MKTQRVIGSRRKVWNGTCQKTPGGLTKADLMMNKYGRIVSRKRSAHARSTKRHHKGGSNAAWALAGREEPAAAGPPGGWSY
jgi:hypothetical protein